MNICRHCGAVTDGVKFCGDCGKPFAGSEPAPVAVAPKAEAEAKQTANFVRGCLVLIGAPIVLLWLMFTFGKDPERAEQIERKDATADALLNSRYPEVAAIFEAQGGRVERDGKTVRIFLPVSVTINMTELQAKQIAGMAQSKLGDGVIVYVKNEAGQTLGKAGLW